jgi:YVTN family beta-propeller protein
MLYLNRVMKAATMMPTEAETAMDKTPCRGKAPGRRRPGGWTGAFLIGLIQATVLSLVCLVTPAPAGDYIYVTNGNAGLLSVIDADRGVVVDEAPVGDGPCDVALDPRGSTLAVSHEREKGEIWLMDRETLDVRHRVPLSMRPGAKAECFLLAFGASGGELYAVNWSSGFLHVIDPVQGIETAKVRIGDKDGQKFEGFMLSPDGRYLYVMDRHNREIFVLDTADGLKQTSFPVEEVYPSAMAMSPDGATLYLTDASNLSLDVIEMATKKVIKRIPVGNEPVQAVLSPDGRSVYVANKLSYSLTRIDALRMAAVANIPVGSYPYGMAVSGDGSRVYVCDYNDNAVSIVDAGLNRETACVPTTAAPVKLAVHRAP